LTQFRKNNTKSRCIEATEKISKGASTRVEKEDRNFWIVEGDERKNRDTDNSEDRRKKRTERKTKRDRRLQKEGKILLKNETTQKRRERKILVKS